MEPHCLSKFDPGTIAVELWTDAFFRIQSAHILSLFFDNANLSTTFLRRDSFQNADVKIIDSIDDLQRKTAKCRSNCCLLGSDSL